MNLREIRRGFCIEINGIRPVGHQPLNQQVYENLKLSILNHAIAAGTRLAESQVARQMGTSTTPVREAFRMLAAEGLVSITPWKGAVVQEYTLNEIQEVFQCREVLETLALDLTISRLAETPDAEERIRRMREAVERSQEETTLSAFVNLNSAIHDFWITGSGNRRLIGLMETLNDVLLHDRNLSAMDERRRREIVGEHREIFAAIQTMDRERARKALQTHIRKGYGYSETVRGR